MTRKSHPILSMTVSRIVLGLLSLLIVTLVIFSSVELLPGSYATAILGQNATPEAVAAMEEQLGLNRPLPIRYVEWLGNAAMGDLGTSFSGRPVMAVIGPRLQNTLILASITAAIAVPRKKRNSLSNTPSDSSTPAALIPAAVFKKYLRLSSACRTAMFRSKRRRVAQITFCGARTT